MVMLTNLGSLLGWQELPAQDAAGYSRNAGLLVLGIAIGLAFAGWLLRRWLQGEPASYNCPRRLWRELRRAHQITFREARLLLRIARHAKAPDPCELFVSPALLQRAAQAKEFAGAARQIAKLTDRLFGK